MSIDGLGRASMLKCLSLYSFVRRERGEEERERKKNQLSLVCKCAAIREKRSSLSLSWRQNDDDDEQLIASILLKKSLDKSHLYAQFKLNDTERKKLFFFVLRKDAEPFIALPSSKRFEILFVPLDFSSCLIILRRRRRRK